MATTPPSQWSFERRLGYPFITEVAPSPNGRRVAYVVREALMTDEKSEFLGHLYLASTDGEAIQLTFGEHHNASPRWAPDGTYLAFLSKRSGKANVHVMRASGGEAWALTRYDETDVTALRWAPDGQSIAFLMAEPPSEEKKKARKAKDDPIQWDQDFDFAHLFVVPFAVGPRKLPEARQITQGRFSVVDFDWLPDGSALAVTHRPNPGADCWPETRLGIVPSDGSAEEPRDRGLIAFGGRPLVSPDGTWIACFSSDLPARWAFSGRIVLYPVHSGEPRPLARTPDEQAGLVGWSADGSSVFAEECGGVTQQVYVVATSGAAARPLTNTQILKTGASANASDQIAFVGQDLDRPNAVYLLDARSGEARLVAQPSLPGDWPQSPLATAEVVRWSSPDGREIEGLLTYPLGYQSGQRYPLVVVVHGGPTGVFQRVYVGAPGYFVDQMDLAERGYAELRPNPRGSSGYGREFRFANEGDWGGGDFQDILAGVDHLVERGLADPDRLGIVGWSYGGYMTSWAITQTHRFKTACVGAGVTNLASFNGTSDIPSFIPDYLGAEFWDDLERYRRHSAIFNVKGVKAPTLILHGEQDVRVPLGQGRELYNALKRQGVSVEMAIYPRQGHGIDEPRLLVDLNRRTAAWLDRWIRGTESQAEGLDPAT